jgi:hypothetical protein
MRAGIVWLFGLMVMAGGAMANAQDSVEAVPKVVEHAKPIYPPLARQTRISGDVRVKVTTDGEAVTNVEAVSGHPLLFKAAEDNVRTWKFATHTASTFSVTFRYKLTGADVDVEFLEDSGVVRLTDSPPIVQGTWAWLYLGTWSVQLTSNHGKARRTLDLSYTGPRGESLNAEFVDPKKKQDDEDEDQNADAKDDEDVDYGHKEGDFVAFTAKVEWRDGKRTTTFFVGKINGDRITGTFVDDAGVRGKWDGVRVKRERGAQVRMDEAL